MEDAIDLKKLRIEVDKDYVGFSPNGSSIKAVHIADGAFRSITDFVADTKKLKRLSYVMSPTGHIPDGNDFEAVKDLLKSENMIDKSFPDKSLEEMRGMMQKLIGADNGVFYPKKGPVKDGMVSFTAGSKYFLTTKAKYEDVGEFVGNLIAHCCPDLTDFIKGVLSEKDDPISMLFLPVLEDDVLREPNTKCLYDVEKLNEIINNNGYNGKNLKAYFKSIKDSGHTLLENLKNYPNSLAQLRMFNFFCIFHLLRYMMLLEAFYCKDGVARPLIIDFSKKHFGSIVDASAMSYVQLHRSLSRFYASAYAEKLKTLYHGRFEEIKDFPVPVYDYKNMNKNKDDYKSLWDLAKENAIDADEDTAAAIFGETIYDMIAIEASSHPVNFLKALGMQAGIIYPPDRLHPKKRFVFTQDILETIMYSVVSANEELNEDEFRCRLWQRFNIIVGGGSYEQECFKQSGMILQADFDSLEQNFKSFITEIEDMGFAELMADGILRVRVGDM